MKIFLIIRFFSLSTSTNFKYAMKQLTNVLIRFSPFPDIIIGGDFNLTHVSWPNRSPATGASTEEQLMLNTLNEFSNTLFLHQIAAKPTHKEGNILDLVLINNLDIVFGYEVQPVLKPTSHHSAIVVTQLM